MGKTRGVLIREIIRLIEKASDWSGKENNLTKIKVRENETIKKKIEKLLDDLSEKELRLVLVFLYNL